MSASRHKRLELTIESLMGIAADVKSSGRSGKVPARAHLRHTKAEITFMIPNQVEALQIDRSLICPGPKVFTLLLDIPNIS